MAGIKSAFKRVMEHCNEGQVLAMGLLKECDCTVTKNSSSVCTKCNNRTKYIIIKLDKDNGMITQFDHESDIHIDPDLKIRDKTILIINDNWNATWVPYSKQLVEKS